MARARAWTSATVAGRSCSCMVPSIGAPPWSGSGTTRAGAQVGALSFAAEQAEELDGLPAGGAEPVRDAGVELGRLAGRERQVVLAEHQAETAVEHVDPLVALVCPRVGIAAPVPAIGGNDQLVCLDAARPLRQRDHRHALPGRGAQVDTGIGGR